MMKTVLNMKVMMRNDENDRSPDLAWQCLDRVAQVFAVPSCKLNDDNHFDHFDNFNH